MSNFSILIQEWYKGNHRDLPWRNTKNPYKIWLAEIILQQTRVQQGLSYYQKFIDEYPDIHDLAKADEKEVLNHWQGLGYYSRARNLHFAAQQVVNDYDGKFPNTYKDILSLKGVGEYTAAAVGSFAFKIPKAVVDGNVYRVLSRYLGISTPIDSTQGKKEFASAAQELLHQKKPDIHNQAIMELGAMICTPHNPKCDICPLNNSCFAYAENSISQFPVKSKKVKVKKRAISYLIIYDKINQDTFIKQRTGNDIWKNLYDFPSIEKEKPLSKTELIKEIKDQFQITPIKTFKISTHQHKLTHRAITADFWLLELDDFSSFQRKFKQVKYNDLKDYPIPRLIDIFLEKDGSKFIH